MVIDYNCPTCGHVRVESIAKHKAVFHDERICMRCGQSEFVHALHGDWCPSKSEDELFSKTSKFVAGEAL